MAPNLHSPTRLHAVAHNCHSCGWRRNVCTVWGYRVTKQNLKPTATNRSSNALHRSDGNARDHYGFSVCGCSLCVQNNRTCCVPVLYAGKIGDMPAPAGIRTPVFRIVDSHFTDSTLPADWLRLIVMLSLYWLVLCTFVGGVDTE